VSGGKFLYWKQTAAKDGPLLNIAERDDLMVLTNDLRTLYLEPAGGKSDYDLLLEKFSSAKALRDELLELFSVNAAQMSGRPGSGRIGPILDLLLELRSFSHTTGGISAVRNEVLDLFLCELFLYTITQPVASEEYQVAGNLLDRALCDGRSAL
jgi:hypothetical protein